MKKSYLMIAAAATLLTACMDNDTFKEGVNDNETVLIGFETFHEKATRATATDAIDAADDLTTAHGGFGVWGYKGAPADITTYGNADPSDNMDDLSTAAKFTNIFDNVKVWYDATTSTSQNHSHFTYAVPKYWDKTAEYVFFAYAPWDETNADLNTATGQITISDIAGIQDVSTSTGSSKTKVYSGSATTSVTDYLMATYVTNQKYQGTNQSTAQYTDKDQTVGFTFGHMLSKLQVNVMANQAYSGVQEIAVTYLSIENMPALGTDLVKTEFTQTSPTAAAGTYNPSYYDENLEIINNNSTSEANANATSKTELYVLQGGTLNNGVPTTPTAQTQSFNYYVAPNAPADNSTVANQKHLLNINYTINYVDGATEDVTLEDIDISSQFAAMLQNNSYILNIKIALNEILFTASVTPWVSDTTLPDVNVPVDE